MPDLIQRGTLRPQLRQQRIGVLHQADHLVGTLGQHSRRFGCVVEQLAEVGIAFVERLREPATPCTAVFSSSGVSEKVCARVASESDSWVVFSPLIVVAKSPRASGSW